MTARPGWVRCTLTPVPPPDVDRDAFVEWCAWCGLHPIGGPRRAVFPDGSYLASAPWLAVLPDGHLAAVWDDDIRMEDE